MHDNEVRLNAPEVRAEYEALAQRLGTRYIEALNEQKKRQHATSAQEPTAQGSPEARQ